MTRFTTHATALLLVLLTGATAAQDDEGPPAYKVELLIFSHLGQGATAAEAWDPTPDLNYPDNARFLVDPRQAEALAAEFSDEVTLDPIGRVLIRAGSLEQVEGDAEPDAEAPAFAPFELLDESGRELTPNAAALQRSGRYKILFHEAWIQPVGDSASARAIVLDRSGDTGDWPELQGSIRLYLSRYLHLQTNLWLNTAGDYLPGNWWMPAPPLAPPSVLVDNQPLYVARAELEPPRPAPATRSDAFQPVTTPTGMPGNMAMPALESPWPYRHAVLVREKRRMRSKEVHYLDHPLLGVVIKFTPAEDLEADNPGTG